MGGGEVLRRPGRPACLNSFVVKKISVLLADDHTVVRQGLRALLAVEPDIEVVGEASNGRQAIQMTRQLKPAVVIMDISMPQLNGLEAVRQIVGEGLASRLLILSSYADDEYVHQFAKAGAAGYLVKQTAALDLIKAVREVAKGNAYFSPSILRRLLEFYREAHVGERPQGEHLTSREQEVLQLVAEGQVNKQIALTLGLGMKTVEKHRQQLMDKLNLHNIAGLTRYAIAHGVVESSGRLKNAAEIPTGIPVDRRSAPAAEPPLAADDGS
jgi:DNA-binding NarL/FixJ family response regulator